MLKEPASIPLTEAYLCSDCDRVGNGSVRCANAACGSSALLSLARVLNRTAALYSGTVVSDLLATVDRRTAEAAGVLRRIR